MVDFPRLHLARSGCYTAHTAIASAYLSLKCGIAHEVLAAANTGLNELLSERAVKHGKGTNKVIVSSSI
jgi:hypothetical protein